MKITKNFNKNKWKYASVLIKNKSPLDCSRRYIILNKAIKKGRWSKEEDQKLLEMIKVFGESWKFISKIFKNRTSKQVRNRFKEHLIFRNKYLINVCK